MTYSTDAGDSAVRFIEKYLTHIKGELGGTPLVLAQWQREFIEKIFGTLDAEGNRVIRQTLLAIPRKNGKSTLAAAIALKLLLADGEPGCEVYSCAADTSQAKIVFDVARGMVENSPVLSSRCKVYRNSIAVPSTHSSYKAISSESYTKHGLNAHGIIFDELHCQPDAELWRTMTSSTGARRQPLTVAITTAGSRRESICYQIWKYAEQVRDGVIKDPTFLPVIYGASEGDDWTSPAVWAKANPNLGQSVKLDDLSTQCAQAMSIITEESAFRMLRLNQWVGSTSAWLRQKDWEKCGGELRADLQGRDCWCGLDLSSTFDTTAFVAVFPSEDGSFDVLPIIWIPEDGIAERVKRDRVPFDTWARTGVVRTTSGCVTDYETVKRDILQFAQQANIKALAVDRWNSTMLSTALVGENVNVVQFGQGYGSLSDPSKRLQGLVASHKIRHAGHECLAWQASCAAVQQDSAANIKPCKAKSTGRIDSIVSLVMALGVHAAQETVAELNWDILPPLKPDNK